MPITTDSILAEYHRQRADAALRNSPHRHDPRFADLHARATAIGPINEEEEARRRMQQSEDELAFCRRLAPCGICPDPCDRFLRHWFQATGHIQMLVSGPQVVA